MSDVTLQRRGRAEISRSALLHNLSVVRAVADGAKICAVVKANAYGHGLTVVGPLLADAGVDYFGVALVDEALELRNVGVRTPILVMGEASPVELPDAIAHDVTVTIGSREGALAAIAAASAGPLRAHVKVDTGMYRQGLALSDVEDVLRLLQGSGVEVEGIFTHFPVADGDALDDHDFTSAQRDAFAALNERLASEGLLPSLTHIANSAGVLGAQQGQTHMIRPGLALYGYVPAPWLAAALEEQELHLERVLTLRAGITAVRRVAAGERPSYGRRRALANETTIVTVPFGYADGFARSLFEAGQDVLIHEQRCGLAGVVTMDQLIINVGDLDVALGDDVVLLGRQGDEVVDADEWARRRDTITWEVLCDIGARVARVVVE